MSSLLRKKYFWIIFIANLAICIGINISYLCYPVIGGLVKDSWSITLFVGQITIFIVFFTFVQFSFSSVEIPKDIIRRYIIEADNTTLYIGYNLSAIVILGYGSICSFNTKGDNYSINGLVSILVVLGSVVSSTAYMFWLVRHTSFQDIGKMIVESINFEGIVNLQDKIPLWRKEFKDEYINIARYFNYPEVRNVETKYHTDIYPFRHGLVEKINLKKLAESVIKSLPNDIKIIKVYSFVIPGKIVAEYENFFSIKYNSKSSQDIGYEEIVGYQLSQGIEQFVKFNEEYKNFYSSIVYLLSIVYSQKRTTLGLETNVIIDVLRDKLFLWGSQSNIVDEQEFNPMQVLLQVFLTSIDNYLFKSELNENTISVTFRLLYMLRVLASDKKMVAEHAGIMRILNYLHYKIIINYPSYHKKLEMSVSHIYEVSLRYTLYKKELLKELFVSNLDYLSTLLNTTIDHAAIAVCNLVKCYYKLDPHESLKILHENIQEFLNYSSFIDVVNVEDEDIKFFINEINIKLSDKIFFLAIIILRNIEDSKIEPDRFIKLIIPIVSYKKDSSCLPNYYYQLFTLIEFQKELLEDVDAQLKEEIVLEQLHWENMPETKYYKYEKIFGLILLYLKINVLDGEYTGLLSLLRKVDVAYYKGVLEKYDRKLLSAMMGINTGEINRYLEIVLSDLSERK